MTTDDIVYVAVANDRRVTPAVEDSAQDAAEAAAKEFDLEYSASDLSNWDENSKIGELNHWHFKSEANWWSYAAIHEVER